MTLGTPTGLTSGGSTSAGLSKSTASISPTPGAIIHAACVARKVTSGGSPGVLTITTAMGGTWDWGTPLFVTDTGGERDSLYVWQAQVPDDVTAGTVSFTSTVNSDVWNWIIWETTGALLNEFGTNHDEVFDNVGTTSFSLPDAPAASSQVYGVLASSGDANGVTVGSGFTVVTQSLIVPIGLNVQYDPAAADASVAWSGSSAPENLMIAWELAEAPSGTAMVVVVGI